MMASHRNSWTSAADSRHLALAYSATGSQLRRRSSVLDPLEELESASRPFRHSHRRLSGIAWLSWRRLRCLSLLGLATLLFGIALFATSSVPTADMVFSSLSLVAPKLVEDRSLTWLTYPDYKSSSAQTPTWFAARPSSYMSASSRIERNENVTLDAFLSRNFDKNNITIFVSLVDAKYAVEGLNFQLKLREFGMDNPVVLLCVDEACLDYAEKRGMFAYGGYYKRGQAMFDGQALQPRQGLLPWIKFTGLLDLAKEGWTNVWIEGDTYLNGNPFPRMLQWEEEWDIQFTFDGLHAVNFGWMYTKPSARSTAFWQRAFDDYQDHPEVWDQKIASDCLNNATVTHYTDDKTYSHPGQLFEHPEYTVWVLDKHDFRSWHLGALNHNEHDKAILNHLTGVWADIRPFVAAENGWKADVDNYYSQPPDRIITSSAMSGTISDVTKQVRILLTVAKATNRTLWLPREVAPEGISRLYIEVFPTQIASKHLSILEGKYWTHAARYVQQTRLEREPSQRLPVIEVQDGVLEIISRVDASSAFSVSLEDWDESGYRDWKMDQETLGQSYERTFSGLHPCTDWEKPLSWHTYYWCFADMNNGHTGYKLDIDE